MQKITLIAALGENACIGVDNQMPWHIPEDFAFFKSYTLGKSVIMGRKTWESLPIKPLPERRNIIISQNMAYEAEGAEVFDDLNKALASCAADEEIIIMGGAQIYTQTMDLATDLRLTEVKLSPQGDAFFPEVSQTIWQEQERKACVSKKGTAFDFVHYVRRPK